MADTNLRDGSGNPITSTGNALDVNVKTGGGAGGGGNAAAGVTGAAVPADADYTGFNSGGNLVGVSAANPLPTSLASLPALVAGSAVIGHVINDASTAVIGHVINDASSAVIGHVIADSGSTTAVTGNVTVVQPTAGNLNATVSGTVTTAPPANASTNVAQVAGTAADTNSGLKSAGTLRVVLATDQPALTNKLLVTPDSVALPANQSVNVSQVAGATINSANPMPVVGTIATNTTAPAAGAEFSFTVTAGKKWRVIGLRASFVTNATVISRFIRIVIDNGTNIIYAVYADDGQVASDSRNYNFVPGQLTTSDVRGERVIGLPENLWLNAAWRIRSLTDSIQTTDQWSNVTLAVEEMPNA